MIVGFTEASYGDFQTSFGRIITLLIAMALWLLGRHPPMANEETEA